MNDHETRTTASALTQQEEFVQLITQHQARIFSFVLAMLPNMGDAEEVMQETSLVLWRRFSEFQPGSNFRAWACQIARYKVLEFHRAGGPRPGHLKLSGDLIERIADHAAEQADALGQRRGALLECIKKLTSRDRDLVERRIRPNSTVPQIAREVGRPVAGLYKAFERIYRSLHVCIDRETSREGRT